MNVYRHTPIALGLALALPVVAAAQTTEATVAQQQSLTSPWSSALGRPGWRFDALAGLETEGGFGSEKQQPITPFGQAGSSESGENLNAMLKGLYEDEAGRRYFATLGNESASAGLWWPVNNDWLVGTSLSYSEGNEYLGEDSQDVFIRNIFQARSSLDFGVSLSKRWGEYTISSRLQTDLRNSSGLEGAIEGRWDRMLTDRFRVAAIGDVSFGDSTNLKADFGVAPGQAGASGLAAYDPGAGLRSSNLGLELEYRFHDNWSAFANANAEYFYSNAGDSSRLGGSGEGSNNATYAATLGVRYRMGR